jgi:hypothetical protein
VFLQPQNKRHSTLSPLQVGAAISRKYTAEKIPFEIADDSFVVVQEL